MSKPSLVYGSTIEESKHDPGFLSLCYHYIRPDDDDTCLLGTSQSEFEAHLIELGREYEYVSLEQVYDYYHQGVVSWERPGLLITFDDGLDDHYAAAQILAEHGIQAAFYIPTCILEERLPANPIIIHYALSRYRISGFLAAYRAALDANELSRDLYDVIILPEDDSWSVIRKIKQRTKYDLGYKNSRAVLLHIYHHQLMAADHEIMETMHLNEQQIAEMISMGHHIGAHSYSHPSIAASRLSGPDYQKEVVDPMLQLQRRFDISIPTMSYPFGGKKDCLELSMSERSEHSYSVVFTVDKKLNQSSTNPLDLGRYMPMSTDTASGVMSILARISAAGGVVI